MKRIAVSSVSNPSGSSSGSSSGSVPNPNVVGHPANTVKNAKVGTPNGGKGWLSALRSLKISKKQALVGAFAITAATTIGLLGGLALRRSIKEKTQEKTKTKTVGKAAGIYVGWKVGAAATALTGLAIGKAIGVKDRTSLAILMVSTGISGAIAGGMFGAKIGGNLASRNAQDGNVKKPANPNKVSTVDAALLSKQEKSKRISEGLKKSAKMRARSAKAKTKSRARPKK